MKRRTVVVYRSARPKNLAVRRRLSQELRIGEKSARSSSTKIAGCSKAAK